MVVPRGQRGVFALGMFLGWLGFVSVWLFLVAPGWGSLMDNLAVAISSLYVFAGTVAVLSIEDPTHRRRFPIVVLVALLVFVTLWLPLVSALYSPYHNAAVVFGAFMLSYIIVAVASLSRSGLTAYRYRRTSVLSVVVTTIWTVLVLTWLWFYARYLTGGQNAAVSFLAILAIIYLTAAVHRFTLPVDTGVGIVPAIRLLTVWLVGMAIWFWFYSDHSGLDTYQNGGIVVVTFALMVLAAYVSEKKRRSRAALDGDYRQ
ncbi:MAG: hypothetical protein QXS20_07025 [Candidatus Thorarchaeota archaeon]